MRISILGVNQRNAIYAGCLCYRGHQVIGVDTLQSRADWFNPSATPALDAGIEALLERGWECGLLSGTTDLCAAVRQTELTLFDGDEEGRAQGAIESFCRRFGEALRGKPEEHRLLIRSSRAREQVLAVIVPILESSSGKRVGHGFYIDIRSNYLDQDQVGALGFQAGWTCQ